MWESGAETLLLSDLLVFGNDAAPVNGRIRLVDQDATTERWISIHSWSGQVLLDAVGPEGT